MNIAIIDDDSLVLESVKRTTRKIPCELYCSSNIEQSLEHLSRTIPDVLIVDQRMPKVDGIDFLEQLDAIRDLAQFNAVFLCSSTPPPQHIRKRLDAVGGKLLPKTMLCNRKQFAEFLAGIKSLPQGIYNLPELSTR